MILKKLYWEDVMRLTKNGHRIDETGQVASALSAMLRKLDALLGQFINRLGDFGPPARSVVSSAR